MSLVLKHKSLKNVAYIRVLQLMANKAINYQIDNQNDGFLYSDLIKDPNIASIDKVWLKKTLPSICHIYNNAVEEKDADESKINNDSKLVIKAEEFMKFINLVEHENTASSLNIGNKTFIATVIAAGIAVVAAVVSIFAYFESDQVVNIDPSQIKLLIDSLNNGK